MQKLQTKAQRTAWKEGCEAAGAGRPRINLCEGQDSRPVPLLRAFYEPWFNSYDDARDMMRRGVLS